MAGQRELRTIGDLFHAAPLSRQRQRRMSMMGLAGTRADWSPPLVATDDQTMDAALALQNVLNLGVPPESTAIDEVAAFQATWNQDPAVVAHPESALDTDSNYGPNTHDALNFVTHTAPLVFGTAPGPSPAPSPSPGPSPLVLPTPNTPGSPIGVIVLGAAVAFAAWAIFFRKKKRGGSTIEVKSNPRRKKGGGRRSSALLAYA
jgi:hypothetical protein